MSDAFPRVAIPVVRYRRKGGIVTKAEELALILTNPRLCEVDARDVVNLLDAVIQQAVSAAGRVAVERAMDDLRAPPQAEGGSSVATAWPGITDEHVVGECRMGELPE